MNRCISGPIHPGGRAILDAVEDGLRSRPDALSRFALRAVFLWKYVLGHSDVRAAGTHENGRAGSEWLRHFLWPWTHRGDHAIPCRLRHSISPSAHSFTNWMDEPCTYAEFRGCLRDLIKVNRTSPRLPANAPMAGAVRFEHERATAHCRCGKRSRRHADSHRTLG